MMVLTRKFIEGRDANEARMRAQVGLAVDTLQNAQLLCER
jgi:hypothetical protein